MTIISFRHNFIFVKTHKTAGTSIEVDLGRRVEDSAIVTPIIPVVPGHVARNHTDANGVQVFYNHMPATEIRDRIGADRFASMFKFCVEREPVDKCISQFHMMRNSPIHNQNGHYQKSWAAFCEAGAFPISLPHYCETRDGRPHLLVDEVLRYDRLQTDLPALMRRLGIPDFTLASRAKSEYSRPTLVTRDQVTEAQRARIYSAFAPTLALTGIRWDSD